MKRLIPLLMLTACSQPVFKPVPVDTPVEVTCRINEPTAPGWPTLIVAKDAGLFAHSKAVLAELEMRKGYENKLLAAIRSCQ